MRRQVHGRALGKQSLFPRTDLGASWCAQKCPEHVACSRLPLSYMALVCTDTAEGYVLVARRYLEPLVVLSAESQPPRNPGKL